MKQMRSVLVAVVLFVAIVGAGWTILDQRSGKTRPSRPAESPDGPEAQGSAGQGLPNLALPVDTGRLADPAVTAWPIIGKLGNCESQQPGPSVPVTFTFLVDESSHVTAVRQHGLVEASLGAVQCVRAVLDGYPENASMETVRAVTWRAWLPTYSKYDAEPPADKQVAPRLHIRRPGSYLDEDLPRELRQGPWWVICPHGEFHQLLRTKLRLSQRYVPTSANTRRMWSIQALRCSATDAVLLRGLAEDQDIRELVDARPDEQRDGDKHTISLALRSQTYELRAALNPEQVDDASQHMLLVLRRGRSDQILLHMGTPDFSVLWAGDLDGDGTIDFVLQMDSLWDKSLIVYMGLQDDDEIVRMGALFQETGC